MNHYHKQEWQHWSGWRATEEFIKTQVIHGTSLVVRWLRLHIPNAGDTGSIPDGGTKIPHAERRSRKKKKKDCNHSDSPIDNLIPQVWTRFQESKFLSTYLGHSDKQLVLGEREPEKSELPKIWET